MLNKLLFVLAGIVLLCSCNTTEPTDSNNVIMPKGGVRYGGEFRFMSSEKVDNLFPLSTTDVYSDRVVSQLYEGLLKIDLSTTEIVPAIAASYEVNENSTSYTFKLRDDVFFHDDECFENGEGRKVTASDFKYSLEFACSDNKLNELSYLLKDRVKGAKAYFKGKADDVNGIKVKDKHTLVIELSKPFSVFHKVLAHTGLGVFPQEAVDQYGDNIGQHAVGTGAFQLEKWTEEKIILKRNNHYWDTDDFENKLPFLNKVVMTYSEDKTDELLSFRAEKIDLVLDIPVEEVQNILGTLGEAKADKNVKHVLDSKSSMSLIYYGFDLESKLFSKKSVRKAFNLAIDREAIIETWLEGEGRATSHGFVPPMEGYPSEQVKGYSYNIEKAQQLMVKAGYPGGRGLPTINLYVNALVESGSHKLAKAIAFSLKQNIGVGINIKLISIGEREKRIQSGEAIFWRSGWVADYPDPENFLNMFYGGNEEKNNVNVNPFNYHNADFDALYKQALEETNEKKRMEMLAKCDQMIIDDAVVMPILTEDFLTMVNLKVKNFKTNEMEQLDFSKLYIKEINK